MSANFKFEVWHDPHAENPFAAWDCEPDIVYNFERRNEEYPKGKVYSFVKKKLTNGMLRRYSKDLAAIFGLDISDTTFDALCENIVWEIEGCSPGELHQVCDILKIPNYHYQSRGYCQGDYASVTLICSDDFFERTGCKRKNAKEIMQESAKLFDAWAWGDTYRIKVFEAEKQMVVSDEDFKKGDYSKAQEQIKWNLIEDVGGFYGSDFKNNGISEYVPQELREEVENFDLTNVKYAR